MQSGKQSNKKNTLRNENMTVILEFSWNKRLIA